MNKNEISISNHGDDYLVNGIIVSRHFLMMWIGCDPTDEIDVKVCMESSPFESYQETEQMMMSLMFFKLRRV